MDSAGMPGFCVDCNSQVSLRRDGHYWACETCGGSSVARKTDRLSSEASADALEIADLQTDALRRTRAHPLREWDEHYGFALAVAIAILSLGTVLLVEWWRS
jgi:predicted RNA-binding Zn-ribbon protein involved in translation (DUF1610 family)